MQTTTARGGRKIEMEKQAGQPNFLEFSIPASFKSERTVYVNKATGKELGLSPQAALSRRTVTVTKGPGGFGFRLVGALHRFVLDKILNYFIFNTTLVALSTSILFSCSL